MGFVCACPGPSALTDIPDQICGIDWKQIRKIALQRQLDDSGTRNGFTVATEDPSLIASWTPYLTALDSTKIVVTPVIGNPQFSPGEARTFGDGNEVPGGVPVVVGADGTEFTSVMYSLVQAIEYAMKQLECETLQAYFINEDGAIFGDASPQLTQSVVSPTTWHGFLIEPNTSFFGDRAIGGFEAPDSNAFNFSLSPGWSSSWYRYTPTDFNALVDL